MRLRVALLVVASVVACGPRQRRIGEPALEYYAPCGDHAECARTCTAAVHNPDLAQACNDLVDEVDAEEQRREQELAKSAPPVRDRTRPRPTNEGPARFGPGATRSTRPLVPAEIFQRAVRSIVLVRTPEGQGTGFVVHAGGVIISNLHVIEGQDDVKVVLSDGTELPVTFVEALDQQNDLVALRVNQRLPTLALSEEDDIVPGQPIVAIGNPLGLQSTISQGIVSGLRAFSDGRKVIQVTAAISPGSSGGPILNYYGEVIGVATFKFKGGENLGFGMPTSYVKKLLKSPRRYKLSAFAAKTAPAKTADKKAEVVLEKKLLHGCTKEDLDLAERLLGKAATLSRHLSDDKEYAAAAHVLEGAFLDVARKVPSRCPGPKHVLDVCTEKLASSSDDEQKATLFGEYARALLKLIEGEREHKPKPPKADSKKSARLN